MSGENHVCAKHIFGSLSLVSGENHFCTKYTSKSLLGPSTESLSTLL